MSNEESCYFIQQLKIKDENLFKNWQSIKDSYKDNLNTDIIRKEHQYTPHDYDRHCVNMYKIISEIVPKSSYETGIFADPEKIFLLATAILLHDIYMIINPYERSKHANNGANYLLNIIFNNPEVTAPHRQDSFFEFF